MKAARVAAAFLIAGPIMWLVVASALYCEMSGHMGMFRFPYTQWWQAAPWWRLNWWMTLYVIASAAVPTLIILGALIATIRIGYGRPRRPSLYGSTGWADAAEMRQRGITRSQTL